MLLANPVGVDSLLSGSSALIVLVAVLFAETGLLVGFFLPGDTLLFAAGVSIATGAIHSPSLGGDTLAAFLVAAPLAAIVGNVVGYLIGYRAGPVVFDRPNSRMFKPEYVTRAERFFARFGTWTVLIARFVPIVRTVTTVMAGVGRMRFPLYLLWSVIGGVIWTDGFLLLGHQLGKFDFVRRNKGYIDYLVIAVVVIGLVPAGIHYWQGRRRRAS